MADVDPASQPSPPAPTVSLQSRLHSLLPLAMVWGAALLPLGFYLIYQNDPVLAVQLAILGELWLVRILATAAILTLLGLLFYPPLPASLRRYWDRTRTAWSTDRAPLLRALSDLKHFETAQKHYEVARLAWIRSDYPLVATHAARSVALDATLPHAQHLLGQFLLRMNQLEPASAAFAAAEAIDPGHAFGDAKLHLARSQYLRGAIEPALQSFAQYTREHGGSHRSNFWYGEALLANGQRDQARQAFVAAAMDPKMRLTAEENWFRACARVRCWRLGAGANQ